MNAPVPSPVPPRAPSRPSIRFRGRSFLALVVAPRPPLDSWLAELAEWSKRTPGFFHKRPVVLDVSHLELTEESLATLISDLAEHGMRLMGVEGANESWLGIGMPPPVGGGLEADIAAASLVPAEPEQATIAQQAPVPSIVVDEPVRSGQSVFFPQGDVTIVGSVASGAEVVAGGSIHIYGTLRGRAIAGANGNSGARIFCGSLEAELLAIDGLYRMADDLTSEFSGRRIHAWLDGGALRIAALN